MRLTPLTYVGTGACFERATFPCKAVRDASFQRDAVMSLPDGMSTSGAPPSGKFTHRTSFIMPFPALPASHQRRSDRAVVTWVAGNAAYDWYSVTGPLMKQYA